MCSAIVNIVLDLELASVRTLLWRIMRNDPKGRTEELRFEQLLGWGRPCRWAHLMQKPTHGNTNISGQHSGQGNLASRV